VTSLYLRFAAPYQSWAGPRATGNHVNTARIPTRTGIIGLCAAALGAHKSEWPDWLQDLSIEVRVDTPGVIEQDFQTINPRPEAQEFVERIWTASGNKGKAPPSFTPDQQKGTSIVRRTYLAGAEFTISISHSTRTDELAEAFVAPGFSPYLGRKAFAPSFPFFLGIGDGNLLDTAPGGHGKPLGIHAVDGRDNSYPDRTAEVATVSFHERLAWWVERSVIPERAIVS
jgi:CRISPR-associated protein Cas5/CasD subtype I-E